MRAPRISLGRLQLGGDATQDGAKSLESQFVVGSCRHVLKDGDDGEQAVAKKLQGVARVYT